MAAQQQLHQLKTTTEMSCGGGGKGVIGIGTKTTTTTKKKAGSSCCSDDMADLERALEVPVLPVQRQDSLYRDASRAAAAGAQAHQQQEGWARTLRLAFQCVGVLYGDIGTSPLYVYSSTFTAGIRHTDDLLGVLSLIIYSFLLFTIIKYVYIALRANDDGDGGTLALYSLISRHAKVSLVPNHQPEDELKMMTLSDDGDAALLKPPSASLRGGSVRRRTTVVQLASPRDQRAQWVKQLLETSKPVRISLFLLTILATAMVITDACLTPAISVLSAVGGLKDRAPNLTTGAGARDLVRRRRGERRSWRDNVSPSAAMRPGGARRRWRQWPGVQRRRSGQDQLIFNFF